MTRDSRSSNASTGSRYRCVTTMCPALVRRAQHARQVHSVVPQRDDAAGAVAAAVPVGRLHALQGVDRAGGRARLRALRGEGGRAAGARAGRLQGTGAGPRVQHLRADCLRAADLRAHHGAVPHGAAAAPQRDRTAPGPARDRLPRHLAAPPRPQVSPRASEHSHSHSHSHT